MEVPFSERRELLKPLIPSDSLIQYSQNFNIPGKELFTLANQMGLEGIVAKKKSSKYFPEIRSKEWLKIKTIKHQEAIIGGYTKNEGSPKAFSALLMGLFIDGEFTFIGPVGTGFTTRIQNEILEKLKHLETKVCPFVEVPEYNKPSRFRPNPPKSEVVWVKPELIAEITYRTVASDGSLRHPSFKGLREDKEIKEVQLESVINPNLEISSSWVQQHIVSPLVSHDRKTLLNPSEETQVRSIEGHSLKFPNLSKIYWPEEKITKRDILNYYYQIAPIMLPYLKDRPQTLNRFPNGIDAPSFYQKDVTGKVPDWIDTFHYYSETDHRNKQFVICSDEASLLYIASLGCIEINPWSSRKQSPDNPDWCIIDLDPDSNSFEQVIETAQVTKQVLDALGLSSYCKTSGSTGLHIYIPLQPGYTYEDSKEFGRALVKIIHPLLPEFTSIERKTMNRKGKIYLDFLQNRPQATVAAPYSLRPKSSATVSMPIHWDEVKKGLKIKDFTIHNAVERVKQHGDLFQGALGPGINIESTIKRMKELFK
jgi:bifunctional non-homologous end joining protein LigD